MAVVYFDSSAFVKLLMNEAGSDLANEVWDGCDAPVSSRLAYPEVRAALATAARNRSITSRECGATERDWELLWGAVRPIELNTEVAHYAGRITRELALKGADAVHLASALAIGLDDLVVAVWDRQLHYASQDVGLRVVPSSI